MTFMLPVCNSKEMKRTLRVKKIYNVIDWMLVPCLSLISISSYVVQSTEETGNMYYIMFSKHKDITQIVI